MREGREKEEVAVVSCTSVLYFLGMCNVDKAATEGDAVNSFSGKSRICAGQHSLMIDSQWRLLVCGLNR